MLLWNRFWEGFRQGCGDSKADRSGDAGLARQNLYCSGDPPRRKGPSMIDQTAVTVGAMRILIIGLMAEMAQALTERPEEMRAWTQRFTALCSSFAARVPLANLSPEDEAAFRQGLADEIAGMVGSIAPAPASH
jgi:hypothetical protein